MPYTLTWKSEDGYLHFTATGKNDPETVARYMAEVRSVALERRPPGILIEESLTGPGLGILDIFALVSEGAARSWGGVRAVAFVDANPEHDSSRMRFAETVAVNRGVNVRVFPEVAAARAWLVSGRAGD